MQPHEEQLERGLWINYADAIVAVAQEAVAAMEAVGDALPPVSLEAARLQLRKAEALRALVAVIPVEKLTISLAI